MSNEVIVSGEALKQCWESIIHKFIKHGFKREELRFRVITCADKKDGARVYFSPRFTRLLKKYFKKINGDKDALIFKKDNVFVKANYWAGLALVQYLMVLALADLSREKEWAAKLVAGIKEDRRRNTIKKWKRYIEENLKLLLFCCIKGRKKRHKVDVFYRKTDKKYSASIKILRRGGRRRKPEKVVISRRYPKNIIRAAAKIFFK